VQVAIAKRQRTEDHSAKKVFIKCHNHVSGTQFDSASATCEAELLNKLSKDRAVRKHLPRLERTVWLDSSTCKRSEPFSKASDDNSPLRSSIRANRSDVLMLEFDRRAGRLLAAVSKEVRYLLKFSDSHIKLLFCVLCKGAS
jgi:hypothetical protein